MALRSNQVYVAYPTQMLTFTPGGEKDSGLMFAVCDNANDLRHRHHFKNAYINPLQHKTNKQRQTTAGLSYSIDIHARHHFIHRPLYVV